jgi:hypothetical protein
MTSLFRLFCLRPYRGRFISYNSLFLRCSRSLLIRRFDLLACDLLFIRFLNCLFLSLALLNGLPRL